MSIVDIGECSWSTYILFLSNRPISIYFHTIAAAIRRECSVLTNLKLKIDNKVTVIEITANIAIGVIRNLFSLTLFEQKNVCRLRKRLSGYLHLEASSSEIAQRIYHYSLLFSELRAQFYSGDKPWKK